jgi:hypothetical protein
VWSDSQEQLLHRLPMTVPALPIDGAPPTVWVATPRGTIDAREASDLIAKLSGKAHWRKIFVRKKDSDLNEARSICREIDARLRREGELLPFGAGEQ